MRTSLASLVTTIFVATTAVVAAPAVTAEETPKPLCVQEGTMTWAVRDSFLTYVAKDSDHAIMFDGKNVTANVKAEAKDIFTWQIDPSKSKVTDSKVAQFGLKDGALSFTAHGNALNLKLNNFIFHTDDKAFAISSDFTNSDNKKFSKTDIVAGDLGKEVTFKKGENTITLESAITQNGVKLFESNGKPSYAFGAEAAPVTLKMILKDCGSDSPVLAKGLTEPSKVVPSPENRAKAAQAEKWKKIGRWTGVAALVIAVLGLIGGAGAVLTGVVKIPGFIPPIHLGA